MNTEDRILIKRFKIVNKENIEKYLECVYNYCRKLKCFKRIKNVKIE